MALSLAGLAPLTSGYYQGKDELMRRQMLEQQMRAQQQQQQGLAALANAYGNQQQMPPPAPPMPPPPGQQSQPMQPPQGQPPRGGPPQGMMPPGQMPPGQMGPPRQQMGPPPQQAPQAPQVKPYTAPQPPQIATPQQQAPQAAQQSMIPAPPQVTAAVQSTLPDLETMASTLKKQGITGMALMAALQQHQQFLSTEGKQQLAQLQEQVRHMQAEAAMGRASAAQTTAGTGVQREDRLERGAEGETAYSKSKIGLMDSQSLAAQARAKRSASGGSGSGGGTDLTDDAKDMDAFNRLFNGKYPPGNGKDGAAMKREIDNRAAAISKGLGMSMAEVATLPAEKKADAVSLAKMVTWRDGVSKSERAVENNISIMQEYSKKLGLTNVKALNSSILAGKTEFSDPDATAYANATMTVMNEYARVMSGPNSNASLTEGASKRAGEMLDKAVGGGALDEEVKVIKREMAGQIKATDDTIEERRSSLRGVKGGGKPAMSDQDNQALEWANANPKDPRSAQIKKRLGM